MYRLSIWIMVFFLPRKLPKNLFLNRCLRCVAWSDSCECNAFPIIKNLGFENVFAHVVLHSHWALSNRAESFEMINFILSQKRYDLFFLFFCVVYSKSLRRYSSDFSTSETHFFNAACSWRFGTQSINVKLVRVFIKCDMTVVYPRSPKGRLFMCIKSQWMSCRWI